MHPVLFEVGGIPINTFGVMIAIGVMIATIIFRKRASSYGIKPETALDLGFWLVIFGTLGARLAYILLNLNYFMSHQHELFTVRFEGLTSYGALITGIPTILYWSKKHRISLVSLLDAISVPYLVGHSFGRIGCFFNGCCYGRYTENPSWGMIFPKIDHMHHYPTQIYDSLLTFIAILIIIFLERRQSLKPTQSFYLCFISYNLIRIFEEIWRQGPGGTASTVVSVFSLAQIVSALLLLISLLLFLRAKYTSKQAI